MLRKSFVAIVAGLSLSCAASAMTVETHGDTVYATGGVENDLPKFEAAFENPAVRTVVFVNSPGGDLWTGLRVGRLVAEKGYQTVVAGSCISACSLMFMGGKTRQFADAMRASQTMVGIHGAHQTDTGVVDARRQPQIYAFLKVMMGERFNSEVINMALYSMDDRGALLHVPDPARNTRQAPYHCRSSEMPRVKCTVLAGQDALSLGVITSRDLVHLALPESMRKPPQLLGLPLPAAVDDLEASLRAIALQTCSHENCSSRVAAYANLLSNRALTIPLNGNGWGSGGNHNTPTQALFTALYNCNHLPGKAPRLCRAVLVNESDVSAQMRNAVQAHAQALAQLKPPEEIFAGSEQYGGEFLSVNGLRTEQWHAGTPAKLPDIQTVNTQALARMLVSPQKPVVLDVIGLAPAIPGSQILAGGGLAFADAQKDAEYGQRFAGLLKLLAPDPESPIVFYCAGRDYWYSANAALRARTLGYKKVYWYRGGLPAWQAAGLVVAPAFAQAAVSK